MDLANELKSILEQVENPIASLEQVKPKLRGLIRGFDNFMQAAQDVTSAAEQSDYSKVATLNAVKRWESKINKVYVDFKFVNDQLKEIVGTGLRRHSGKGKSINQRKAKGRGGKDFSGIAPEVLKKQLANVVKSLAQDIHKVADDGAFLLQQIDRITGYKNPSENTVGEEMAALWQDFVDFRESFGAKVWAPLKSLLSRLDAISEPLTKLGPLGPPAERGPGKQPEYPGEEPIVNTTVSDYKDMWGDFAAIESCITDKQKQIITASMERDQKRLVGKFGISEAEKKEEPGFKGEPSAGGADKMAAKGYKFKILLKDKPPLYAKTEKGAKEVQADYPGSKIVANEAIDGIIDDKDLVAESRRPLVNALPDFDSLFEDDLDPSSIIGEAADLVREDHIEESTVGQTIIQQLGGMGRLGAMLGIQSIVWLPKGVGIKWPNKERTRGNYVEITLRPDDTYDVEFFNAKSAIDKKSVKQYSGIYVDGLRDVFEKQTGWYLSL